MKIEGKVAQIGLAGIRANASFSSESLRLVPRISIQQ
jgi:hypothetical protein